MQDGIVAGPGHSVLVQALGSGAEEYARILDLVGRYAISRPDVGFSCKKQVR